MIEEELAVVLARGYSVVAGDEKAACGPCLLVSRDTKLSIAVVREHGRYQILFSYGSRDLREENMWASLEIAEVALGSGLGRGQGWSNDLRVLARQLIARVDALETEIYWTLELDSTLRDNGSWQNDGAPIRLAPNMRMKLTEQSVIKFAFANLPPLYSAAFPRR